MVWNRLVAHENSFLFDSYFSLAKFKDIAIFNGLRLILENADYVWTRWLIGFDQRQQLDLFERLVGQVSPQKISLLILAAMAVIAFLIAMYQIQIWRPRIDNPVLHQYQRVLQALAKKGLHRPKSMASQDFAEKVSQQTDQHTAKLFKQFNTDFITITYQTVAAPNSQQIDAFLRQAKQLQRHIKSKQCVVTNAESTKFINPAG